MTEAAAEAPPQVESVCLEDDGTVFGARADRMIRGSSPPASTQCTKEAPPSPGFSIVLYDDATRTRASSHDAQLTPSLNSGATAGAVRAGNDRQLRRYSSDPKAKYF